jgi:hypothetical protein
MSDRPRWIQHEDVGAALLLAIGFVLMVSAIGAGLASLATSSVNNRNTLELVRNRQYAADGVIEEAIAQVRDSTCESLGSSVEDTLNGVAIRVDWVNACQDVLTSDHVTSIQQRNVIFSAFCKSPSDTNCNFAGVVIRAQVNFEENPPTTYIQSWSVNR